MLHITKKLVLGLGICLVVPAYSQMSETDLYAMISNTTVSHLSIADEIVEETNRIVALTKELATTDSKKSAEAKRKIEICQKRILKLTKALPVSENAGSMNYSKFEFDEAKNSLHLEKFKAERNGTHKDFEISFKTAEAGIARVDIVSPGGELLDSYSATDFHGSLRKTLKLSSEVGKIYFVHITVGDREVTKKVKFN